MYVVYFIRLLGMNYSNNYTIKDKLYSIERRVKDGRNI